MTGTKKTILPVAVIIFLTLLAGTSAAAVVSVVVPTDNTVSGPRILLGQVAAIELLDPRGAELAQALAEIDLGPAPAAGQTVVLRRAQLEQRLTASRLNLAEARWALPAEIRLTAQGQELSEDVLRRALEKYLAETEPYRSGQYQLINANFSSLPTLPPGRAAYRFVAQGSSNPAYLSGNFFFSVDGKEVARARVTAQIDLNVRALVAVRPLSRGHVLDESDVSLTLVPYAQAKGAVTDPALVVGGALKSGVNAGEAIKERMLAKSVMIKRGDMVTIVAQQGGLKITAAGQAKQDGSLGENIAVINLGSKKTVTGRVIGPSQVEVVF